MASYRLLHVVRDGSGDTNGLAEYTNSDTVLLPVHSSDPSESNEGAMIYNSSEDKIKIYDGSAWQVVGNTSAQIQAIVGAMFTGNTETGIQATYQSSDGTIDLVVSADSAAITDGDSDFTITDGVASGIHYELDNTDMANWNQSGIQLTTSGGIFRHNQTQAASYTIASGEGAVMAGPVTITGTITNNGTLVIM